MRAVADDLCARLAGNTLRVAVLGPGGSGRSGVLDALAAAADRAGRAVLRCDHATTPSLLRELPEDALVVVDTAAGELGHDVLDTIAAVLRGRPGVSCAVAALPTGWSGALGGVVEVVTAQAPAVRLGLLDDDELGRGIAELCGAPPDAALVAAVLHATTGVAMLVERLTRGWAAEGAIVRGRLVGDVGSVPALVTDLVAARAARLDPASRAVLVALALAEDVDVRSELVAARPDALDAVVATGLVTPEGDMAGLVRVVLTPAGSGPAVDASTLAAARTLLVDVLVGRALPPVRTAELAWTARVDGERGARCYEAAGVALLDVDPVAAAGWFARAGATAPDEGARRLGSEAAARVAGGDAAAGMHAADLALRRHNGEPAATAATAAMYAGRGLWLDAARWAERVHGHERIAEDVWRQQAATAALLSGSPEGRAAGSSTLAGVPPDGQAGGPVGALAALAGSAVLSSFDAHAAAATHAAVAKLVQLAEAVHAPAELLVSPFEAGAIVALAGCDLVAARRCLTALRGHPGARAGHVAALTTWVDIRLGRPVPEWVAGGGADEAPPPPGAELLALACVAAVARRNGDVATGAIAARRLAALLERAVTDLCALDPLAELLVLARRFGPPALAVAVTARIDGVLAGIGNPAWWSVRRHWAVLESAAAERRLDELAESAVALRHAAAAVPGAVPLAAAGEAWRDVVAGRPDLAAVESAVAALRDANLTWEAAQLAGQAAIRVEDAGFAKALLTKARSLRTSAPGGGSGSGVPGVNDDRVLTAAGLSEREVEVGRLVLDGLTQKEIGATLYISPKTVEHHVAHIRTKLVVSTRAEFVAALRADLDAFDAIV